MTNVPGRLVVKSSLSGAWDLRGERLTMRPSSLFTELFAFSLLSWAEAKASTTATTTRTIFLPSRSTGSATNIYASIITEESSTTEFLLACQTAFSSPYSCDGEFQGVTLTYGESIMDVAFGPTAYDCNYTSSAVCETRISSGPGSAITIAAQELSSRMTAITILDVDKKKTTKTTKASQTAAAPAQTTAQQDSGLCKRKTTHNSGDSSDSGSDSGGSGSSGSSGSGSSGSGDSDDGSDDSDSSDSTTKKKKTGDGCSEGSLTNAGVGTLLLLSFGAVLLAL